MLADICLIYKQLFRPEGTKTLERGTHYMGLDEGLQDIKSAASTLEKIANAPHKGKFIVRLNNCETIVGYEEEISEATGLTNVKEVLDYLLQLPQEHRPEIMHVHLPNESYESYCNEVELLLNKYGKTLKPAKAVKENRFPRFLRKLGSKSGYGSRVLDMSSQDMD
jgi:hypothetical protein